MPISYPTPPTSSTALVGKASTSVPVSDTIMRWTSYFVVRDPTGCLRDHGRRDARLSLPP